MSVEITSEALSVERTVGQVLRPEAGGVDVFLGVVRSENDGRAVTRLEYQAYETMAKAEMGRIVDELLTATPGLRLAASHRIGTLFVGDIAVICAASAPHRHEAFVGCRRLIDEIKARVPIWKREFGPDGAAWVGWVDARCHGDHVHRQG